MAGLMRALAPMVGRICGAIALDEGDDAMQETMIAVLRKVGTVREPAAVRGWARRIAVREAVRVARRRAGVPVPDDVLAGVPAPTGDPAIALDVRAVLRDLAPEHRAILVLRDLEGLSEADAAALLDVAPGTVKSRLHRARDAFKKRWES